MICEEEPPRPSARISTLGEAAATISICRNTEPARLSRLVRGDLDWIVMRALEKDPARRYQTASDLAEDIQRHLANEPISARPPMIFDRAAKWARRHRLLVRASAAVLAVGLVALLTSTVLIAGAYRREKEQRGLAVQQKVEAEQQKGEAVQQKVEAQNQRDAAEENLYLAHVHLAWQDWHAGQVSRIHEMLEKYLPRSGRRDLRGWEWYFLLSLCHREQITLRDPDGLSLNCMSWNAKRNWLAGGSASGRIHVWDPTSGKELFNLRGSASGTLTVAWSPDGDFLAAGSRGDVRVWDVRSRTETSRWSASNQQCLSWSPDGKSLAYSAEQGITIRRLADGNLLRLDPGIRVDSPLAWSPDGKYLAIGGLASEGLASEAHVIRILDPSTGREIKTWQPGVYDIFALAWSPDGKRLASGTYSQQLQIWETGSWRELLRIPHSSGIEAVAWSPDGRYLASGTNGAEAIVWDSHTGERVNTLRGHTEWIHSIAWSADGQRLATLAGDGIRIWDTKKTTEFVSLHHAKLNGFAWCPDGSRLATAGGGKVKIWDSRQQREIASWDRPGDRLVWHPYGKRLTLISFRDNTVQVVNASTGKVELTFPCSGKQVESSVPADWSPDGTRLAFASDPLSITLVDGDGKQVNLLRGDAEGVLTVRFSPDGRFLASSARDGTVRVWDPAAGKCLVTFRGHAADQWISGLAWSPDGKRLASGGWDQRIEVWDAGTGKALASLRGHTGPIFGLDWSPDGKRLVLTSGDGTVKLWNTGLWEEVLFIDIGSSARQVRWSPSGKQLAVHGLDDNTIKLWDAASGYELAESPAYRLERARLDAGRAEAYVIRGTLYGNKGEYDKEIADLSEAIRLDPKFVTAYNNRGFAYLAKREFDKAIADLSEAIRLDPKGAMAYENRGSSYNGKGEHDKAIADLSEAIRLDPELAMAYNCRSVAYGNKGEHDRAIADLSEAIRLDPKYVTAYSNRGAAYGYKGEYDKAIADCTEAIRLDPKLVAAYNNRGFAYLVKREYDKAIADYTEGIRLDPKLANPHAHRGAAYAKKGEYDKAIADCTEAIRLDSNNARAHDCLARLYATCPDEKYRDGKKAVENENKAYQLTKGKNWSFVDTLAAAYAESGEFQKAREWETKAIELAATDKSATDKDKTEMGSRLELYKLGKPYREAPKK